MPRNRLMDALAGLAAAAVALGVAELLAALAGAASLVVSVSNVVVDRTPGPVVKWGIDLLGTNDKPFLLTTVTAVSLLLGFVLGPAAGRRPVVGQVAFAVFGLAGVLAGASDPLTGYGAAFWIAVPAALVGWLTLRALLDLATPEASASSAVMPGRGVAGRRKFLALAGTATGGAVVAAVGGQMFGSRVDVEAERASVALPEIGGSAPPQNVGLMVEGLPPYITPNEDFYRIDTAFVVPRVDASGWRLKVHGMVDTPYTLTFADLAEMATLEECVTLSCVSNEVGGDLVGTAIWIGVPLATILDRAGVQPGATQIVGRSVDGFTVGFPTAVAVDGRASMVAIGMNGTPLPAEHGFPARLVIPGLYGYVSATKWLSEIELTRLEDFDAYWIPRGWSKEAPIKTQSRIDVPRGNNVNAGRIPIAGVAWGGIRDISKVEVRVTPIEDDREANPEWLPARLSDALSDSSWRQWVVEWDARPGTYNVEVRATDGEGVTQTSEEARPDPDGATGWHMRRVTVREAGA
ncbi:MAG: molybdopterin-dependent oxidoreductase [Dehalococcoidia bacterium]|nr:molybdopterin-dependent oxidoreductase [Dehalococcoidia bacterium]